jgi:hypothetical protein
MILESVGGTIKEDFEEFLRYRLCAGIGHSNLKKWSAEEHKNVGLLDVMAELEAAGLDRETADDTAGTLLVAIGQAEEESYSKGVKYSAPHCQDKSCK